MRVGSHLLHMAASDRADDGSHFVTRDPRDTSVS